MLEELLTLILSLDKYVQLAILLIVVLPTFVFYKLSKNPELRRDFFKWFRSHKVDTTYSVRDHEIFISKPIYKLMISNISFNKDIKNSVFRIILNNKVDITIDALKDFVSEDFTDVTDIEARMNSFISSTVSIYETVIKDKLLTMYHDEDGSHLYKYLYESKFKHFHNTNITYTIKGVMGLANSRISNNQKLYLFSGYIKTALDMAIVDCEKEFDKLNGELNPYNDRWHR